MSYFSINFDIGMVQAAPNSKSNSKVIDLLIYDEVISTQTVKIIKNYGFPLWKNGKFCEDRRGNLKVKFKLIFPTNVCKELTDISERLEEL